MGKPLNVELFNKVLAHIREDIRRLYMSKYGIKKNSEIAKEARLKSFPACNTKACIAGWAVLLTTPKREWKDLFNSDGSMGSQQDSAADLLGLDEYEAIRVFGAIHGSSKHQFAEVKETIRTVIRERIKDGEITAKDIKV